MLQKLRKGWKTDFKLRKAESPQGREFCPILFYVEPICFCLCRNPLKNRIDGCHALTTASALPPRARSALILPAARELSNTCLPAADAFHRRDPERVCAHPRRCANRQTRHLFYKNKASTREVRFNYSYYTCLACSFGFYLLGFGQGSEVIDHNLS